MTVISGVEIGYTKHRPNEIKDAIMNNDPIEDVLHVICVISNPCLFSRRYILLNEFVMRMRHEATVSVYVVELCYGDQEHVVTKKGNPKHLQLRTDDVLWHKENMINLGVKLLPKNYKAFAWIDADVEFENADWAMDTLKILNGSKDVVQLFSHCVDMDRAENQMNIYNSAGYQFCKNGRTVNKGLEYSHPGYAWAITRRAYEKLGGLFEVGILGSGDHVMRHCILQIGLDAINEASPPEYKAAVVAYQKRARGLRLGYVPGMIRHYFHGTKENRKYNDRWRVLLKYEFVPAMVARGENGILRFSGAPEGLKEEVLQYFWDRKEDD